MPANYSHKRRIGAFTRSGGVIGLFTQYGDLFMKTASVLDIDVTNPGTSAVTRSLSVVGGIQVDAIVQALVYDTGTGNIYCHLSSLDQNDEAPSGTAAPLASFASENISAISPARMTIRTNTSGQIRSRVGPISGAGTILRIATLGWIDTRGRLA